MQSVPGDRPALFPNRRWLTPWLVLLMLCAMALQIATSVHGESVTWDEGDHLFSGFMSLRTHDFGLNPEHPPMAKMVAALPLMALGLKVPPLQGRFFKSEAYFDGRDMLFGNTPRYTPQSLLFRARMAMLVFPLSLALLVFFTGREMFGEAAGLLAMLLVVTEPNILTHGPFVTTDTAASVTFLATIFCFYRYCRQPTWPRLLLTGLAAGLALAAKHSTILLAPMLLLLIAAELYLRRSASRASGRANQATVAANRATVPAPRRPVLTDAAHLLGALAVITVVAVAVLWTFYGWRYNARPGNLRLDPGLAEWASKVNPFEAKGLLLVARLHLLPESYLYGLADVRRVADFMPSYLFGKVYAHGVLAYFPAVLLIKSTLAELVLFALAVFALATGWRRSREVLFLALPPLVYLVAAMASQLNIGVRHILPMYGFLLILAAGGAVALAHRSRGWAIVIALLACFHIASSAHAFPTYMAYSNEAWGGPSQTHRYLTDSNTDWGQQLLATKRYTDVHNIHDCWIAYFVEPFIRTRDYGIPCKNLPTFDSVSVDEAAAVPAVISGPVFISAGDLNGFEFGSKVLNPLQGFMPLTPVDTIQHGIFVYQGTFAVPLLSAMSHVVQSGLLLKRNDAPGAIREGEAAVAAAPDGVQPREALADALHAAGRNDEARHQYQLALDRVNRDMEPGARALWTGNLSTKIAAAR